MLENELIIVKDGIGSLEDHIIDVAFEDFKKGLGKVIEESHEPPRISLGIIAEASSFNPDFLACIFNKLFCELGSDRILYEEFCRACPEPPVHQTTFEDNIIFLKETFSASRLKKNSEFPKSKPVFMFP